MSTIHVDNSLEQNKAIYDFERQVQINRIFKTVLFMVAVGCVGFLATKPFEYSPNVFLPTHENYLAFRDLQGSWKPGIEKICAVLLVAATVNLIFCKNELLALKKDYGIIQSKISKKIQGNAKAVVTKVRIEDEELVRERIKNAKSVIVKKAKPKRGDPRLN